MFIDKSQYSLYDLATYWSNLSGEGITESDLMNIAGIDTGISLLANQSDDYPKPKLIICAYYTGHNAEVIKVNGQPATMADQYLGRIFLWPSHILRIQKEGNLLLKEFVLADEDKLIHLNQDIQIKKEDLVIKHEEKVRFENEYIYPKIREKSYDLKLAECLNINNPYHSEELKIAIESWLHLSQNHSPFKKTIKQQAAEYLTKQYPNLSKSDGVGRIATVINWKKNGAAKSG